MPRWTWTPVRWTIGAGEAGSAIGGLRAQGGVDEVEDLRVGEAEAAPAGTVGRSAGPRTKGYGRRMNIAATRWLDTALDLPAEDRLAIAAALLESVEGHPAEAWDCAWLSEVEARDAAGEEGTLPWTEVRGRVLQRLSDQRR